MAELERDYDGWVIATHTRGLALYLPSAPEGVRTGCWVKSSAGGSRPNTRVGYSHEFVLFQQPSCRRGGKAHMSRRDVLIEPITRKRGVIGTKPVRWTRWVLDLLGYSEGDEVVDMFPGSGSIAA